MTVRQFFIGMAYVFALVVVSAMTFFEAGSNVGYTKCVDAQIADLDRRIESINYGLNASGSGTGYGVGGTEISGTTTNVDTISGETKP